MAWKNWGDHPVVVTVGVLAGLAGLITLGYTIFASSSLQQATEGNNSPNISASNGDVQVSIDNSTEVQAPSTPEIPSYSGKIGHLEAGKDFIDFIFKHKAQVVYLDAYFDAPAFDEKDIHYGDDWFSLWSECNNLPENQPPSYMHCLGASFNLKVSNESESIWDYDQGFQHLQGYWSIRANDGMHQGQLSVTLTAVDTKDAQDNLLSQTKFVSRPHADSTSCS